MNVIGIDLSLTSTGLACIRAGRIDRLVNIKTTGKKSDTWADRAERLRHIGNEIAVEVEFEDPDLIVIEAPSYGSRFGSAHDRSGLWWSVVQPLLVGLDPIPVAMVAPQTRAKYGTGAGNSKKDVVFAHVKERYQSLTDQSIKNDDLADALLLAAMGSRFLDFPVEPVDPPQANLAALGGVLWPSL